MLKSHCNLATTLRRHGNVRFFNLNYYICSTQFRRRRRRTAPPLPLARGFVGQQAQLATAATVLALTLTYHSAANIR